MKYGKIINGEAKTFQKIEFEDGGVMHNPAHLEWLEHGYLPIIEQEHQPEIDGYYQVATPNIVDNQIIIEYLYCLNPIQDDNV